MSVEDEQTERKSLRLVTGRTADWSDIARACVAFANGAGGHVLIGIEDGESQPPASQRIPAGLLDQARKRVAELTVNVQSLPSLQRADNGGEFIDLVVERSAGVASTADGRYFVRVADACIPVVGDDVLRLASERPGRPWETMLSRVACDASDADKKVRFVDAIRASDRVKASVKEKSADELLRHYALAEGECLPTWGAPARHGCRPSGPRDGAACSGDQVRQPRSEDQQMGLGRRRAVPCGAGGDRVAGAS